MKVLTIALLWWRWKDTNKIVASERRSTEVKLIQLITRTAAEFEQLCTKEYLKQKSNQTRDALRA
jgi:hypothetical protein